MHPYGKSNPVRNSYSGRSEGRFLEPSQLKLQATGSTVVERTRDSVKPVYDFRLTKDTGVVSSVSETSQQSSRRVPSTELTQSTTAGFMKLYNVGDDELSETGSKRSTSAVHNMSSSRANGEKVLIAESASAPGVPIIYRSHEEKQANPDRLNLDRRRLTVCPILDGEEQLRLLNYQHNHIRKIANLASLKKLIFLDLYDNHIEEISGLSSLRALRVLMLGKNRIKKIEHLDSLTKLDVLDLHGNEIQVVENISHLTELRVLNLAGNRLTFVDNVVGMLSLAELNLRRNQIKSLTNIDKLPSLQRLFLSCNELTSFDDILCLSTSPCLQEISLDGNPLASDQFYKQTILSNMQQLKQLDMKRVTDEEKRISAVMARKEEDRRRELHKISIMKEKRKQAIHTAKKQWEMMQASLIGKSNRLTKMPEIYASHVGTYDVPSPSGTPEESQSPLPGVSTGDTFTRPHSAQLDTLVAGANNRNRSFERISSKHRSQSESRPVNPSQGVRPPGGPPDPHDRGNGLAELDNDTLTCYGPGSVDSLDRNFGIQAAGAVTCIVFKFIEFGDIVTKAFNKIRAKFPAACKYEFNANNIHSLDQLNALSQLKRIEALILRDEGNPVTQLSMWKPYVIYRLAHMSLKSINGTEVTASDVMMAERMFGTVSQHITALPNYRIISLLPEPKKKQVMMDDKASKRAESLSESKALGVESVGRAVLGYTTADQDYTTKQDNKGRKKLAHSYVNQIAKEMVAADYKAAKLSNSWNKTFTERVQNLCIEILDSEAFMNKSMEKFLVAEQS